MQRGIPLIPLIVSVTAYLKKYFLGGFSYYAILITHCIIFPAYLNPLKPALKEKSIEIE